MSGKRIRRIALTRGEDGRVRVSVTHKEGGASITHDMTPADAGAWEDAADAFIGRGLAQARRVKGSKAPKRIAALWNFVQRHVADNPRISAKALWALIPENDDSEIFRDGEQVFHADPDTGRLRSITFKGFQRYVTGAKQQTKNRS